MSSLSVRTLTDQEVLDVAGEAFPTANVLNRCAIGDRDPLSLNHDGSLDLRIQHQSPGADRECNWLPAPAGACNVLLRLYAPKATVIDRRWVPPPVRRVD